MNEGRPFDEWLREQMTIKRISQRSLSARSGVHHSTISRLLADGRSPSLATATALARALREYDGETDLTIALSGPEQHPAARVEYALRADRGLDETAVRKVMDFYLRFRPEIRLEREPLQPLVPRVQMIR